MTILVLTESQYIITPRGVLIGYRATFRRGNVTGWKFGDVRPVYKGEQDIHTMFEGNFHWRFTKRAAIRAARTQAWKLYDEELKESQTEEIDL